MNATPTTAQTAINAIKVVMLSLIGTTAVLVVLALTLAALNGDLTTKPAADTAAAATAPVGCWNEPNAAMPGGVELIYGPVTAAPVGSTIVDCPR